MEQCCYNIKLTVELLALLLAVPVGEASVPFLLNFRISEPIVASSAALVPLKGYALVSL